MKVVRVKAVWVKGVEGVLLAPDSPRSGVPALTSHLAEKSTGWTSPVCAHRFVYLSLTYDFIFFVKFCVVYPGFNNWQQMLASVKLGRPAGRLMARPCCGLMPRPKRLMSRCTEAK